MVDNRPFDVLPCPGPVAGSQPPSKNADGSRRPRLAGPTRRLSLGLGLALALGIAGCGGGGSGGKPAGGGPTGGVDGPGGQALDEGGGELPEVASHTTIAPLLTTIARPANLQIVADAQGNALLAWPDPAEAYQDAARVKAARYRRGSGWSAPVTLEAEPGTVRGLALGVDRNSGWIVATWHSRIDGATVERFIRFNPATETWEGLLERGGAIPPGTPVVTQLAVDGDGGFVAASTRNVTIDSRPVYRLYAARYRSSSGFETPVLVDATTPALASDPGFRLERLPAGGATVVWLRNEGATPSEQSHTLMAATQAGAGQPWQRQVLDTAPATGGLTGPQATNLSLNGRGRGVMSWRRLQQVDGGYQTRILVSRFDGQWQPPVMLDERNSTVDGATLAVPGARVNGHGDVNVVWWAADAAGYRRLWASRTDGTPEKQVAPALEPARLIDEGTAETDRYSLTSEYDDRGRLRIFWYDELSRAGSGGGGTDGERTEVRSLGYAPSTGWTPSLPVDVAIGKGSFGSLYTTANAFGDSFVGWVTPGAEPGQSDIVIRVEHPER